MYYVHNNWEWNTFFKSKEFGVGKFLLMFLDFFVLLIVKYFEIGNFYILLKEFVLEMTRVPNIICFKILTSQYVCSLKSRLRGNFSHFWLIFWRHQENYSIFQRWGTYGFICISYIFRYMTLLSRNEFIIGQIT